MRNSGQEFEFNLNNVQKTLVEKEIYENALRKTNPFFESPKTSPKLGSPPRAESPKLAQKTLSINPLTGHEVTKDYRTKMMDWMVEVCTSFKCSKRTYFLAV